MDVDVVVLTALDLEYGAVRAHLTRLRTHTDANGTRYETGEIRGGHGRVALGLTGPGNLAAAALTTRVVAAFEPKALLFVGIAGGLARDIALGDVVVATRVHDYQGGRADASGFQPRPASWPLAHALDQDARDIARDGTWRRPVPGEHRKPVVHFKPLVSGDVVLDDRDGLVAKLIAEHYSDAVAIDMESAGVAAAAHHNDFHRTVMIRAVSDRADGSKRDSDSSGWQHRAVANAAAFAVALAERIAAGPGSTRPVGVSPYRGLAAFGEGDANVFFGRRETADELAARVAAHRFVAVVGRSGSGKSSLVHAGLAPRMRGKGWAIATFRPLPGVPPSVTLAGALLPLLRPGLDRVEALAQRRTLADTIAQGRLAEVVAETLDATRAQRLLVCVDQFEELRVEDAEELAGLLVRLAAGAVHVVVTIRAETLDLAVHRLGLGELTSVFLLAPMTQAQLREVVEGPVRSTGVRFDDGLVTRILEAASDAPGALTLTQFALTRLWDEQDHGRLTHDAYDRFGGVAGALATYAEQVWAERLDETQRAQARRLLVQLVRPEGDGVVRRTARGSEAPELIPLAHHLATTRLLVTGTDEAGELTIDLAHAALATHWRRLRDWLAEERDFRAWQEDLRDSVRHAEPLRGARLATAVRWLRTHPHGIPLPELDFVRASRRRQRLRTIAWRGLLVIVAVLAVFATTFAVNLRQQSDQLANQLEQSAGQLLVGSTRDMLSSDPDNAALLSVAAYRTDPTPGAMANLAAEYLRFRETDRIADLGIGPLGEVLVSADGSVVAASGTRGAAVLTAEGKPVVTARHGGNLPRIALSADGRFMASAANMGQIEVWGPAGERTVLKAERPSLAAVEQLQFDSTGTKLLAEAGGDGVVWDRTTGERLTVPDVLGADTMWFGPGGESVIVVTGSAVERWPLRGGDLVRVATMTVPGQVVVSGDGRTAIFCAGQTVEYWDVLGVREPVTRPISQSCTGVAVDHTGRYVTAGSPWEDQTHPRRVFSLVDVVKDVPARVVVPAHDVALMVVKPQLAATASGVRLVAIAGSSVVLADVTPDDFTALDSRPDTEGPLFSESLRYAVSMSGDETLRLWDVATGAELNAVAGGNIAPQRFVMGDDYVLAFDALGTAIVVLEVPSLRVVHQIPVPDENRAPTKNFCFLELPDPGQVAFVHAGRVLRLDVRAGTLSARFPLWRDEGDADRLNSYGCAIRPGTAEIAVATTEGVELWDVNRGELVATLPGKGVGMKASMGFSPSGGRLAVLGFDGGLEIWDVEGRRRDGGPWRAIGGYLGVGVLGFPSEDRVVLRGNTVLRVWDVDHGATVADVPTSAPGDSALSGNTVMYWGFAGVTRMPLDPKVWADHLCEVVGRDLTPAERGDLPAGSSPDRIC